MFGLTYLSRENKMLLAKAQDKLTRANTPKGRNDAELLIQEILSEGKPYQECDLIQAQELREQLIVQIRTLEGLGKNQSSESFRMHLKDVDYHIQTRFMEAALQESSRTLHQDQPPNLKEGRLPSLHSVAKEKKKQKSMGRARWTVDMDEIADET